jgi:uncharacterized membrane protein YeiB
MEFMTSAPVSRPTEMTGRSLAPDLARGTMLLLIAVANAPWYLWTATQGLTTAHPTDGSALDRVVQFVAITAIDGRSYPMFAFLFGYGIWQLYSRQLAQGTSRREARRLLRRRHLWMLAFGAVHALLLWMGDIVGAYGLAGLVLVWLFLDRRDRTIRIWAIALSGLLALSAVFAAVGGVFAASLGGEFSDPTGDGGMGGFGTRGPVEDPNYLTSAVARLGFWLALTPLQGLVGLAVPIAILAAIVAARHRVLEEPVAHLPLLRRTAVIGIVTGWVVGAITAMQHLGFLGVPAEVSWAFSGAHAFSGMLCGIGYVALFGLVAARLQARSRPGPVAYALQAVGKRSLTFYLAQSVVFAPLMSAWGLGLGAVLSSWSIALAAMLTWALTVVIAVLLERRGVRGPAETLLRRLAYPTRPLPPRPEKT